MKAFLVKLNSGDILDAVIRATDEADARSFVTEEGRFGEIRADVADAVGAPDARGRYDGVLTHWMIAPTTITGDLNPLETMRTAAAASSRPVSGPRPFP
jgi:hypothetical protein